MNQSMKYLVNGLVKENPVLVLMLGMCPALAVTTSATNGLGMGLTTTAVLVCSNMIISSLRNIIPKTVRIPAYIVIIASLVTIVELLLEGFIPALYASLGIYIPLIVVNCTILGRAEAFASKNGIIPSFFDGLGMGLGFALGLTSLGAVREILGAGELFGMKVMPASYTPITIFILAPGAFFVLALLTALQNIAKMKSEQRGVVNSKIQSGCGSECATCVDGGCGSKFYDNSQKQE
ncbi:MAG: electron transport complex subunit E [Eubacteriales bacterium]